MGNLIDCLLRRRIYVTPKLLNRTCYEILLIVKRRKTNINLEAESIYNVSSTIFVVGLNCDCVVIIVLLDNDLIVIK